MDGMDGMDSMNGALFLFCLVPASLFDSYSMRIKEREKKNEKRFPCHRPYCPYRPWRLERRSPRSLRCTAPDFLDSFFDYHHAAASRASSL
jgi:hypothetical protein